MKHAKIVFVLLLVAACAQCAGAYYDYAGAIHIHTVYSDGTGTFDDIAAAGTTAGMDFLITSDHNTLSLINKDTTYRPVCLKGFYGRITKRTGAK